MSSLVLSAIYGSGDHKFALGVMNEKLRVSLLIAVLLYSVVGLLAGAIVVPPEDNVWLLFLALMSYPLVGFLVLIKRPGNRIGLLMIVIVVFVATALLLIVVAASESLPLQMRAWAEALSQPFWFLFFGALGSVIILFPSGSISNRLDRIAILTLLALLVVVSLLSLMRPGVLEITGQPNPMGVGGMGAIADWALGDDGFFLYVAAIALALASVAVRWRTSEGVERLQFRWFGAGAVVFFLGVLISTLIVEGFVANRITFAAAFLALPVAIGIAILRYRLYDIDRIISRTAAYALVVGILAAVFVMSVTLSQQLLPVENQFGIVVSTLVVAAVFSPLRRRVQSIVDRRFNRTKYEAQRVLDEFAVRLRNDVDLEPMQMALLSAAQETMQPSHLSLWVRERGRERK